jgi:hypothetical protein
MVTSILVLLLAQGPAAAPPAPATTARKADKMAPEAYTAPLAPATPAGASRAGVATATTATEGRLTAVEFTLVLKVAHPTQARREILARVAEHGGFPTLTSDTKLTLKVPPDALAALMGELATRGLTLEKSLVREDVTEAVAKLEGRLRSKSDILAQLRRFFGDSNVVATLQIEKSMTALITELEQVKGELRVTRERARWAVIHVDFQYNVVSRVQYVHSPFDWLNRVDLDAFLERFESR